MGQHLQALSLPLPCRLGGAAIAQEPAGPELPATGPPRPPISRYRALRLQGSRACSSGAPASPHTRRAKKSSPRHGAAAAEPRADCRRASSGGGRAGRRPRQMDDGDIPAFWPLLARPPRRRGCRRLPTNGNVRAPGHVCHAACESSRRRYLGCPRCPADDRAPWSLSSERHSDQCHHIRGALSAPRLHWARGLAMDPRHSLPLSQQTQTARLVPHPPHHGPSRAHGPSPIAHRDQDHSLPAARQAKAGQARPGFNAPLARQVLVLTLRLRSKALLSSPSSRLLPQPTAPRAPRQPAKERDNGHVGVCLCLCPAACPNRVSIASQRVLAASLGCRLSRRHNAITSHAPKRHRPAHAPGGPHRSTAAAAPFDGPSAAGPAPVRPSMSCHHRTRHPPPAAAAAAHDCKLLAPDHCDVPTYKRAARHLRERWLQLPRRANRQQRPCAALRVPGQHNTPAPAATRRNSIDASQPRCATAATTPPSSATPRLGAVSHVLACSSWVGGVGGCGVPSHRGNCPSRVERRLSSSRGCKPFGLSSSASSGSLHPLGMTRAPAPAPQPRAHEHGV